jgi:type I restriction enzyme S subunit
MRETLVKAEEFKDSLVGRIPKDWDVSSLAALTQYITYGFTNPMPTTKDGPWMITAFDIANGKICYGQARHTSEKAYKNDLTQKSKPNLGDILITKDGTLGRIAVVDRTGICINQSVACLRPLLDTDVRFLVHYLRSDIGQERMLADAGGSTIKHIYITKLAQMEVPVPPREERTRISDILDTIDSTIAHTSSLIAKLKQMKAGLLHDLLTRGLDENGELRDAIAHPEQFKDSPLGQIPKDWKIYNTGAIATIKYGINDAVDQTLESGVLTITLPCVSKTGELTLHKELLALSARHKVRDEDILQAGDLLFNWRNGSQEHLGKTAYFKATGEYTHVGFLLRIRANSELCDSRYLWWRISYMKSEGLFLRATSQVNNTFNSEELANMRVIVPPIPEQQRIVKALEPCEQRIRAEEAYRDKLKLQKKGLMHDLLTGMIRVKDT